MFPLDKPDDVSPGLAPAVIDRNRTLLAEAKRLIYKSVGGYDLEAYLFSPDEGAAASLGKRRPVLLCFYSGAWDTGLISQFAPHCLYFAHRGMLAFLIEYRGSVRHKASPLDGIADAKSAVRWVRMNAEALGADPQKIVGCGAASGGHVILCAGMVPGFDDTAEDAAILCAPNAFVLFSPILDCTRKGLELEKFPDKKSAKAASPLNHVRRKLPPILIFHGTQDRVVPFETSRKFVSKMRWRGNTCVLSAHEGQGHGFFNFNVDATRYELTVNEADHFLVQHGILPPAPEEDAGVRLR